MGISIKTVLKYARDITEHLLKGTEKQQNKGSTIRAG
jgi:hypothetical protein